jgi:hypothetical protein
MNKALNIKILATGILLMGCRPAARPIQPPDSEKQKQMAKRDPVIPQAVVKPEGDSSTSSDASSQSEGTQKPPEVPTESKPKSPAGGAEPVPEKPSSPVSPAPEKSGSPVPPAAEPTPAGNATVSAAMLSKPGIKKCSEEANVKTLASDTGYEIAFTNKTKVSLSFEWINTEGKRVFYFDLAPGATSSIIATYLTHPWLISNTATKECSFIFLPAEPMTSLVIE